MNEDPSNGELVAELAAIKRLLILQLLQSGVKQKSIAAILGISDATMSRLIGKGLAASLKEKI